MRRIGSASWPRSGSLQARPETSVETIQHQIMVGIGDVTELLLFVAEPKQLQAATKSATAFSTSTSVQRGGHLHTRLPRVLG